MAPPTIGVQANGEGAILYIDDPMLTAHAEAEEGTAAYSQEPGRQAFLRLPAEQLLIHAMNCLNALGQAVYGVDEADAEDV